VKVLVAPGNHIFAVGDDDQAIYTWRGADPESLREFSSLFPGAQSVILGTNYRSARRIVRHAAALIANNQLRVDKSIEAAEHTAQGRFEVRLFDSRRKQAEAAAEWILALRQETACRWGDFAVLFRVNRAASLLESVLAACNVPTAIHAEEPEALESNGPGLDSVDRVHLLSIHKSKGKEFRYVVYFNLSRRAEERMTPEDERRVVYVGLTRAREGILVTADRDRPSRYLRECALMPGLNDFALPYLERILAWARKKSLQYVDVDRSRYELDLLEEEIRLRKDLEVNS